MDLFVNIYVKRNDIKNIFENENIPIRHSRK